MSAGAWAVTRALQHGHLARNRLIRVAIGLIGGRSTWSQALALDLKPTDLEGSHLRAAIAVTARDKLLVFLTRRDVEATNNASERALRPSVIFRKVTNGFRSEWGAKVYADLRSIVATGCLASKSALAAIRDTLAAPAPDLTPASSIG